MYDEERRDVYRPICCFLFRAIIESNKLEGKRTLPAFLQIGIAYENLSLEAKDIVKIIIGFDKSRAKKEKKKPNMFTFSSILRHILSVI